MNQNHTDYTNIIQVCSDIHLNYGDLTHTDFPNIVSPNAEILVLAGDIGDPYTDIFEQFISYCSSGFVYVLFVAGNHEYYKHKYSIKRTNDQIHKIMQKFSNVHYLNNKTFKYKDITFIGSTLWSHIADEAGPAKSYYMNECRYISGFSPLISNYLFKMNLRFIKDSLNTCDNCIVITHHAPSMKCIPEKYEGDPLNCCFASELDYLFQHPHIKGWIYGHTHHNYSYVREHMFLYGNCYRGEDYQNTAIFPHLEVNREYLTSIQDIQEKTYNLPSDNIIHRRLFHLPSSKVFATPNALMSGRIC